METSSPGALRWRALVGTLALCALVVLGAVVRSAGVAQQELGIDRILQLARSTTTTTIALALTTTAQEAAGLAALVIGIIVLIVRRRRWDATVLFCMAGASWALALVAKAVVMRPRPPASVWLLRPDPTPGFPSGHTTTALVIVLIAVMVFRGTRWMPAGVAVAVVYAVAVGASRLYLGDHYPTDILGSLLTVGAAALLVSAVLNLGVVHRAVPRILQAGA